MTSNANTEPSRTVALGAGSYWAAEKFVVEDFQLRFPNSIESAEVGFMNPHHDGGTNTLVGQVSTSVTGYIEVLNVTLKDFTLMEELIKFFFMFHDPTTQNRQGTDIGPQYASVIFCSDIFQNAIALRVKTELQAAVSQGKIPAYEEAIVETAIVSYTYFYPSFENQEEEYIRNKPSEHPNNHFYFDDWSSIEAAPEATVVISDTTTATKSVASILDDADALDADTDETHSKPTAEQIDFAIQSKRRNKLWRRCRSFQMSKRRSTPFVRRSHPNRKAPLAADLMAVPGIREETEEPTITTQEEEEQFPIISSDLNLEARTAVRTTKNRLSTSAIPTKKDKRIKQEGRRKRKKISRKLKSSFAKLLSGIQRPEQPASPILSN